MDTSALRQSLRQALIDYRERRPNLSLRAIARNSGVNRYFLNKLLEDKATDSALLDLNQVLLFLQFITKKNTITEIMASSSEDVRQLLAAIFPSSSRDRVFKNSHDGLNLYDYYTYFILHFAALRRDGMSREAIVGILGQGAVKPLAGLIAQEILQEEDGRITLTADNDFTYPPQIIAQHLGHYSRFFDSERLGQKRNFISALSQGVNGETLSKIQEIYVDAYKKVDSLMRDERNWGLIPAFAVSCVDSFVMTEEAAAELGGLDHSQKECGIDVDSSNDESCCEEQSSPIIGAADGA